MMDLMRCMKATEEFQSVAKVFGLSKERMHWPLTEMGKTTGGVVWVGVGDTMNPILDVTRDYLNSPHESCTGCLLYTSDAADE